MNSDPPAPAPAPAAGPRYTAWQVAGFVALILALVAGACAGGLLVGFAFGRTAAPAAVAPYERSPELPPPVGPNAPQPPLGRPYLGVRYVLVTPALARQEDLSVEAGALIRRVDPDSPALEAGVEVGDVITQVDGLPLDSRHDLRDVISTYAPGETVGLTIVRGEHTHVLTATLGSGEGAD